MRKKDMPVARINVNCEPWIFSTLILHFTDSLEFIIVEFVAILLLLLVFIFAECIWPLHPSPPPKREVDFPYNAGVLFSLIGSNLQDRFNHMNDVSL